MYHLLPYAITWIIVGNNGPALGVELQWEHFISCILRCYAQWIYRKKVVKHYLNMIHLRITWCSGCSPFSHWPFIAWEVYENAVMLAVGNVNVNAATETNRETKISCYSHSFFLFLLLPMGWQRLWQWLLSNLSFSQNISPYKNNQKQKFCSKAYAF